MYIIIVREYRRGNKKKDNPEKLATPDEDKQKHNTICVGHHFTQTNTNNVNKPRSPTNNWSYRRSEHRFYAEIVMDITTRNNDVKTHFRTAQEKR